MTLSRGLTYARNIVCSFRNLAKTNPHPQDRVQLFDEEFGAKAFINVPSRRG